MGKKKRDKKQPEHDKPRPSTTYHPAHTKPSENHIASIHQSRSIQPATYVCTVPVPNFHEQPTVEADRTMKICLPTSICLSSLRYAMVRYDLRWFATTRYSSRIANYPKENRLA